MALIALASLGLTVMVRTTLNSEVESNAMRIEIKDFNFNPDTLQVKAEQTVRLVVRNDDTTLHTFTLNVVKVDVSISPGAERLVEFQAPAPGTYQWYCLPHSDSGPEGRTGMVGSLVVH